MQHYKITTHKYEYVTKLRLHVLSSLNRATEGVTLLATEKETGQDYGGYLSLEYLPKE